MSCPTCGYNGTCVCWWWESLQPGGQNAHLMPRAVEAMRSGMHEDRCPCLDCVADRDVAWLVGRCSVVIPDYTMEVSA